MSHHGLTPGNQGGGAIHEIWVWKHFESTTAEHLVEEEFEEGGCADLGVLPQPLAEI